MAISSSTTPAEDDAFPTGAERTDVDYSPSGKPSDLPSPWKFIFKNDSWLKEVLDTKAGSSDPVPCLGGIDLPRLWDWKNGDLSAYLFLLVNDWPGDTYGIDPEIFLASLHPHEFDGELYEVKFKDSGIILNVHDIFVDQWEPRPMTSLRDFFGQEKDGPGVFTYVDYYALGSDVAGPQRVGPELIQGIEGVPWNNREAISEMCQIQLKFRDGAPVTRMLRNRTVETRIKGIYEGKCGRLIGFEKAGPDDKTINDELII